MSVRTIVSMFVLAVGFGIATHMATLWGAAVSRQQADAFAHKIEVIERRGSTPGPRKATTAPLRTPVSESEINSWFTYRAGSLLPEGLTQPSLTIIGNGQVTGNATVDLDAVSKSRSSGHTFDLWNLVGGKVPVTVSGIIRTQNGHAKFDLQDAAIRGIPVPRRVVQELVAYYSKTAEHPDGHRLDEDFELPSGIQTIEITPGNAVVVQ